MKKMQTLMASAALCMLPICAQAAWQTTVHDDAFSSLGGATMIDMSSSETNIAFDCKGAGLSIAYLEHAEYQPGEDLKSLEYVPMMIKVDGKTLSLGEGEISRRNNHYIAIESTTSMGAYDALYMVRKAKKSVVLGVKMRGQTFNASLPATNARHAADKLAATCGIDLTNT